MKKLGQEIDVPSLRSTKDKLTMKFSPRGWFKAISLITFFVIPSVYGARPAYDDQGVQMREMVDSIKDLRREVINHEIQITSFEEKFKTQEDIIDSLRKQLADSLKTFKDTLRAQTNTIESKSSLNEDTAKNLLASLKTANADTVAILSDYKIRIAELEKFAEQQSRNIENLQAAMSSLTEVLQGKEVTATSSKIYVVKPGDTLEKIAKQNGTTIKKLKEWNNLTKDQIMIGQKLQVQE